MMVDDLGRGTFERRLAEAYDRAGRRPTADRPWTTELPSWWMPTDTVERRRALSSDQRRRWLRRGAA